jgi:hypothetical protein
MVEVLAPRIPALLVPLPDVLGQIRAVAGAVCVGAEEE